MSNTNSNIKNKNKNRKSAEKALIITREIIKLEGRIAELNGVLNSLFDVSTSSISIPSFCIDLTDKTNTNTNTNKNKKKKTKKPIRRVSRRGMITVRKAAIDILKETGRPMHGSRELYPEMLKRGVVAARKGVFSMLSRMDEVEKVKDVPNTWVFRGPAKDEDGYSIVFA